MLGLCVGSSPQREQFVLPIPTCCYLKSLVDPTRSPADPTRAPPDPMQAPLTQREPQREPVEYGSRWVRESWVCVGHVYFMLFVSILFALGTQREPSFFVEYGLLGLRMATRKVGQANTIRELILLKGRSIVYAPLDCPHPPPPPPPTPPPTPLC